MRTPSLTALCLSLLTLVSAGCSSDFGKACSGIGCTDQVLLQPKDPSGGIVTKVQGTAEVDGQTLTIDCVSGSGGSGVMCGPEGVTLIGVKAATIKVSLASGDLAVSDLVITPTYSKAQPNGEGCDPICQQATESVPLGGGLADAGGADGSGGADAGATDQ